MLGFGEEIPGESIELGIVGFIVARRWNIGFDKGGGND